MGPRPGTPEYIYYWTGRVRTLVQRYPRLLRDGTLNAPVGLGNAPDYDKVLVEFLQEYAAGHMKDVPGVEEIMTQMRRDRERIPPAIRARIPRVEARPAESVGPGSTGPTDDPAQRAPSESGVGEDWYRGDTSPPVDAPPEEQLTGIYLDPITGAPLAPPSETPVAPGPPAGGGLANYLPLAPALQGGPLPAIFGGQDRALGQELDTRINDLATAQSAETARKNPPYVPSPLFDFAKMAVPSLASVIGGPVAGAAAGVGMNLLAGEIIGQANRPPPPPSLYSEFLPTADALQSRSADSMRDVVEQMMSAAGAQSPSMLGTVAGQATGQFGQSLAQVDAQRGASLMDLMTRDRAANYEWETRTNQFDNEMKRQRAQLIAGGVDSALQGVWGGIEQRRSTERANTTWERYRDIINMRNQQGGGQQMQNNAWSPEEMEMARMLTPILMWP